MATQFRLDTSGGGGPTLYCAGNWTAETAPALEDAFPDLLPQMTRGSSLKVNIDAIDKLDTIGAWLLTKFSREAKAKGVVAAIEGGSTQHHHLLERVETSKLADPKSKPPVNWLMVPFVGVGMVLVNGVHDAIAANAVLGRIVLAFGRTYTFREPLRFASLVYQFEQIILRAAPIVLLISLVVGAIITQQTILQLRVYGASIFVVDLSAILMFREIGVLLAAIMVAGRSGSAITAEIGSMRMREEFDALQVMGVDPHQALLLPRIVALVVGLPLLAFLGSLAGLLGAAIVAKFYGDITFSVFIDRLRGALTMSSLVVGLVKAPFMAFLVGLIASIEGLKVEGSSESLGRHTTSAVVKSIFVVIVADGLFAIFFAALKV
ncbi:MAG TPA: ABC transporter permease [Devosiaceae bacterium]|jgi:phospholipid/cholesterol/gamma-HCH transport system permease protein